MFKVDIEKMISKSETNKILKSFTFETKKEANKKKKELIKEFDLSKHHYFIVNYETMIELTTNY